MTAAARPLEIGISLGGASDAAEWQRDLRRVDAAESLGLHSVWLPEGHFQRGATSSPLVGLAAFAARTRRLRLGTTSLLLPIHDPLRIARELATADRLSGGRLWIGLGRGFRAPVFAGFGVAPGEKRDRFDRALDSILCGWAGGGAPAPLQRPHPPLLVAAFGRKGLAQAARRGLAWLASPLESFDVLAESYAWHRERLPPEVEPVSLRVPVLRSVHVAASDTEADRVLRAVEEQTRRLARAAAGGPLARAARGGAVDRVLIGTPERVVRTIAACRARFGLDLLIARAGTPGASEAEHEASLERLVREVLPQVD